MAQTGSALANAAATHLGSGVPTAQRGLDGSPELQPPEVSASSQWLCNGSGGACTHAAEWGSHEAACVRDSRRWMRKGRGRHGWTHMAGEDGLAHAELTSSPPRGWRCRRS